MRVLLIQPRLDPPGGGNLVAAWMLQALRDEHELSLLAWAPPDLAACNRYYGTSLRAGDFQLHLVPAAARVAARLAPTNLQFLKDSYLLRRSAALAMRHDVVLTANNEGDFGRRGVQYVHYPRVWTTRPSIELRWYHKPRTLLELYYRLAARVARFSATRMKANLTLVNSRYIAEQIRALHGLDPTVLHPPVPGTFPSVPWEARRNGFVLVGRIAPEKRIETAIEILRRVRAAGTDVTLAVIGTPEGERYWRHVRDLARRHADWVTLHADVPRDELLAIVARHRYGIHAMPDEHFGIAVAEMIRGGCVVFVPDTGGPAEIVGDEARLRWTSPDDAVAKIRAALRDPAAQTALRDHLAGRAALFSADRFCAELRRVVRDVGP